jgi:hypothetical protein
MTRSASSNEFERRLLNNIAEYGWHCNSISAEDGEPGFTYTVGLFHSFGHPELLVIGLPPKAAHGVLSVAAKAAAEGKPFDMAAPTSELLNGYSAVFVAVPSSEYENHVLSALWFYEGAQFPLYQVVWPSAQGYFPWHPEAADDFKFRQPVLGAYAGIA